MEITSGEISAVIRLVREVCARWDDPQAWRNHLLQGACTLLQGNVGTMFAVGSASPGQFGAVRPLAIFGLPSPEQKSLVHSTTDIISHREVKDVDQNFVPGQTKFWAEFSQHGS